MITIALVEDNISALQALKEKLSDYSDLSIKYEACNGEEIVRLLSSDAAVDLIFMDIEMPRLNGIDATCIIKQKFPHIKIVMITIYDNDDFIFRAIQAGADSYILKETKADKIYETIVDTLNGGAVMSPSIAVKTLKLIKNANDAGVARPEAGLDLSERETAILEHLSQGLTNKKIAEVLFISPFTVKRHIENIYKKLQAGGRVELVEKARRKGLL
jgi:DNA-binding NarL/FixJ family response regulator